MTVIPRALARLFRAVLRRSVVEQPPRGEWPLLLSQTGPDGLRLSAVRGDLGVCYCDSNRQLAGVLAFRSSLLREFEGGDRSPVTLERAAPGQGRARWFDRGVARLLDFETATPESVPALPEPPQEWADLPDGFLAALAEAASTAAKESGRYSLSRMQLRGKAGQVVATDGRQLLIQRGFRFPWADDLLVPRCPALAEREVQNAGPARVGRTASHVAVEAGPWTFFLGVDPNGRFPDVQAAVPRPSSVVCRLHLDPTDAAFLDRALPKLPGQDDDLSPVTLDLDGKVLVRAKAQDGTVATEVELTRSRVEGKSMRLCLDRTYLRRALRLGFTEIHVCRPDRPIVCRDRRRLYILMPLEPQSALPPGPGMTRLASAQAPEATPDPIPERNHEPMSVPRPGEPEPNGTPRPERCPSIAELIGEAEGLRSLVQDLAPRLARLLSGLKQHRRQSRAMEAAMQSLRQLKLDG